MSVYDNGNTSGTDNFPVIDISHKPKRMQGHWAESEQDNSPALVSDDADSSKVITLERAIAYYKVLAMQGKKNSALYEATANWLFELLTNRSMKTIGAVRRLSTDKTEETEED